jgi:two-component system, chemotaxis family, sensor kinase Cph1
LNELSTALCEREPIHIPGAAQSHGVLLALQATDRGAQGDVRVVAASVPARAAGADGLQGFLDARSAALVSEALAAAGARQDDVLLGTLRDGDGRAWSGVLHADARGTSLLELEPDPPRDSAAWPLLAGLNRGLADIQRQDGITKACEATARAFSALTGFDRVMVYRFHPDWTGAVEAEIVLSSQGEGHEPADSYLGLMFPASDIPAQARALYVANGVRLIPDAAVAPLPLTRFDGDDAPIDLTRAVLRAVAPVHLRYLANMGVRASMSVAVTTPRGALWGLVACHHLRGPLQVGPDLRQAAEMLARALSWRISELDESRTRRQVARMREHAAPLLAVVSDPLAPGSQPALDAFCAECKADALALLPAAHGAFGPVRAGMAPGNADLAALAAWLDRSQPGDRLVTDRLFALLDTPLAARLGKAGDLAPAGLLALRLAGPQSGWLLLLRREWRHVVTWAGDPRKQPEPGRPAMAGSVLPLSPRASFAAWTEEIAGRSAAWSEADIATAVALRDAVAEILVRRSAEIERNNAELRRRNEETRFFADAAAHDLKEPLWQIQVLSGLVKEQIEDLPRDVPPAPEAVSDLLEMMGSVVGSSARMRATIDDLTQLAVAGRDPERTVRVRLRDIVEEALDDLGRGPRARAANEALISLDGMGEACVGCDPLQIRRVFQNLLSNAFKYRDPQRRLAIRISVDGPAEPRPGDRLRIFVADNGLGFDPRYSTRLFEPFRRFPAEAAAGTEGLGLGLAICQRIVLAHGGTIEASSGDGEGARFCFTLAEPTVP